MRAIAEACADKELDAVVAVVFSPASESQAVENARALGLEVAVFDPKSESAEETLIDIGKRYELDLICLAGYMRLIPTEFVKRFENAILNIHPALLPNFGGKGMYGMKVHEAVLASGDKQSGATVHFVNERYDEGAVFHQITCEVLPHDTPESLAARVLSVEHRCYVEAIRKWIANRQSARNASL